MTFIFEKLLAQREIKSMQSYHNNNVISLQLISMLSWYEWYILQYLSLMAAISPQSVLKILDGGIFALPSEELAT